MEQRDCGKVGLRVKVQFFDNPRYGGAIIKVVDKGNKIRLTLAIVHQSYPVFLVRILLLMTNTMGSIMLIFELLFLCVIKLRRKSLNMDAVKWKRQSL